MDPRVQEFATLHAELRRFFPRRIDVANGAGIGERTIYKSLRGITFASVATLERMQLAIEFCQRAEAEGGAPLTIGQWVLTARPLRFVRGLQGTPYTGLRITPYMLNRESLDDLVEIYAAEQRGDCYDQPARRVAARICPELFPTPELALSR